MTALWAQLSRYFTLAEFKKGIWLRVGYILLQLTDYMMTVLATNAGFTELNPVMRGLLGSPLQLVLFKLVIPLAIAWLVPSRLLIPALVLLLAVIGLNVKELMLVAF